MTPNCFFCPLFNARSNINIFADLLQGVGADPEEDPLKWIEENIPESAETENPLPVIDSDEEIETVSVLFLIKLLPIKMNQGRNTFE